MKIGVPKEIKNHEYRVGLTPASVYELTSDGHKVYIETNLGVGAGLTDEIYKAAGAEILPNAEKVFEAADLIIKVKEPQASEYDLIKENHILFTYLHLAPDSEQAKALMKSKCSAIAYDTIEDNYGRLPLLAPMSEVAGRMSIQVGAWLLEKAQGGKGLLLGGVPGVNPGRVTIIGGGSAGTNAARVAIGMGAEVTIIDNNPYRLRELHELFGYSLRTLYSNKSNIEESVKQSDLVIGAVLVPGDAAPKLVTEEMVKSMEAGSAIVDIAIDQGGCIATSHPTTHANPYFLKHGVIHYCVTNMPGAVARTSCFALNNSTLPYAKKLAVLGLSALKTDAGFAKGLNVHKGHITNEVVAHALGEKYHKWG